MPLPRHRDSYHPLLGAISVEGGDVAAFLRAAGVDPEALVPESPEERARITFHLLSQAIARFGEGFPIRCGARLTLDSLGVYGYAILTAPNVASALERGLRYRRICFENEDFALVDAGAEKHLVRRAPAIPPGFPNDLARALVELGFAEHVAILREIAGPELSPRRVEFAHPAPRDVSFLERFFRAPLRFDAPRHALVFDEAALSTPTRHGHPALAAYFETQARELLAHVARPASTSARVREVLVEALNGDVPRLPAVAKALGVGEKTLARRLADEGTTFQQLLDDVRRELALRHLANPALSIAEVAFLLGFSEASAFHRAFRRWTGKTPHEARGG